MSSHHRRRSSGSRSGGSSSAYAQRLKGARDPTLGYESAENINVNGVSGHYVNKSEAESSWRGDVGLTAIQVFQDSAPEVVRKKATNCPANLKNHQTLKALKVCEAKPVGDIIIEETPSVQAGPQPEPPPLHLVLPGKGPSGNKREVHIQEQAPAPQRDIGEKVIRIPSRNPAGKAPHGQRQLIVESLPDAPDTSSEDVHVVRWLAPAPRTRRVIFKPAPPTCAPPAPPPPKNLHVIWEPCSLEAATEFRFLGQECAQPGQTGSGQVVATGQLPQFALSQQAPAGERWASDARPGDDIPKLVGDLEALKLIDLDREGLSEYRAQLGL